MKTIKKTYTVTQEELELIKQIKDRALSRKIIINDSQIIRLGISLVSKLGEEKLIKSSINVSHKRP